MTLTKTPICDFGKKAEDFKLQSINNKSVSLEEIKGGDPKYNAECFLKMIEGSYPQFQKIVELNAGAALYLSGKVNNLKDGFALAKKVIDEKITKNYLHKITS